MFINVRKQIITHLTKPDNFNVTAEIPIYIGNEIPIIPYYRPGSGELSQVVIEAMTKRDCVILSNHDQVVCGKSFDDVFQKAVFFEMACGIIVRVGKSNYTTISN